MRPFVQLRGIGDTETGVASDYQKFRTQPSQPSEIGVASLTMFVARKSSSFCKPGMQK
jgi:hypothetical protein